MVLARMMAAFRAFQTSHPPMKRIAATTAAIARGGIFDGRMGASTFSGSSPRPATGGARRPQPPC